MEQQAIFERARLSRDARFDGRFFIGVRTTGIYCRPVCPAVPPRADNVVFYPSAAAAAEAGFRPCLRCRPECAPGTPAWNGTSTTVRRGLRLIAGGALDDGSVEELAERLGVTGRHLRRLFVRHVGASPLAVASTRRLQAAKRLIDETALPLNRIAIAAGYGSVRRFNAAFRATYGRSPRELRRPAGARSVTAAGSGDGLAVRLAFREPFDWDGLLGFLKSRLTAGVEHIAGSAYLRTVAVDGAPGVIECSPDPARPALVLRFYGIGTGAVLRVAERVRELFDLDAPVAEIGTLLGGDGLLRDRIAAVPGVRVPGSWDPFELTVRAILGQQVSVKAATTLAGRLAREYGEPVSLPAALEGRVEPGRLSVTFPEPARLQRARLERLGIIGSRARSIRALARAVAAGEIVFDAATEPREMREALCTLPGIGAWTAQYVAMRALKDPDAFPASDLGLVRASGMKPAALRRRAEAWRPWRAYAAMLLWSGAGNPVSGEPVSGNPVSERSGG